MTASPDTPLLQGLADQFLISSESVTSTALLGLMEAGNQPEAWRQLVRAGADHLQGRREASLQRLQTLMTDPDPAVCGRAYVLMSRMELVAGRYAEARQCTATALAILSADDRIGRAFATMVAGGAALQVGEHDIARSQLASALHDFETSEHFVGQSKVLTLLVSQALFRGHLDQAETWVEQAETVYRKAGWQPSVTLIQYRAHVAIYRGRFDQALAWCDQGIVLAEATDNPLVVATLRNTRGTCLLRSGDLTGAQGEFAASLPWCQQANQTDLAAFMQLGLAEVARQQGDLPSAREWCETVRRYLDTTQPRSVLAAWRLGWSKLLMSSGQWQEAWDCLTDASDLIGPKAIPSIRYEAYHLLVQLADHLGDARASAEARAVYADLQQAHGFNFIQTAKQPTALKVVDQTAVDVRCFDAFTVTIAGQAAMPISWRGHRVKLLLAALILEPEGLTKEVLTDRLYPKQQKDRSAIALLVNRLRRALDGQVPTDAGSLIRWAKGRYQLNPTLPIQCDLWTFEQAWQQFQSAGEDDAKAMACWEIIARYAGPLFVGFHDEPWVLVAHQRTRRQWQEAHTWLQAWTLQENGPAAALELADTNLALDPASELAHRFKITTLLTLGQKPAATEQYQTMVQCLKETNGTMPSPESEALLTQLRAL